MEYTKRNFWNFKIGQAYKRGKHFDAKSKKILNKEGIKVKPDCFYLNCITNHKTITTIVIATVGFILLDASLIISFVNLLSKI